MSDDLVVTFEQEQLLRRQLALRRRQLELAKDFGLLFYKPFPKQAAFHAAGDYRLRMMRSGNRFGKSTLGCAEDCGWLLGERMWLPESDPVRRLGIPQHPVKGLVITTDWDKVNEVWTSQEGQGVATGKLWRMLPRGSVRRARRNHSGAVDRVELERGSILSFDTVESFKKNPQGTESGDYDFIHIDEPCPEQMWKAASRGLMDRNGKAWFTLTPLSEFWINDLFFPQNPADRRASIWALVGNTRDNPYLTEAAIAEYEAGLSEDERTCRLEGIPLELSGLVYKEFQRETHVLETLPSGWKSWDNPPLDHTIYAAIDPHPRTPHAVMFIAVGPLGLPIVYDEIFLNMTSRDLAKAVLKKLEGRNYAPVKCDPIAWIEDPVTGASMQREFLAAGLAVHKASKAKEHGILHMRSVLKDPRGVRFVPTLYRTLWEISRYCYDKENKPVDKDDHMMENMYRLFINNPEFQDFTSSASINPIELPLGVNHLADDELITSDFSLD